MSEGSEGRKAIPKHKQEFSEFSRDKQRGKENISFR